MKSGYQNWLFEMAQWLHTALIGPDFSSQYPHQAAHNCSITPVLGGSSTSGLHWHLLSNVHTNKQTHMYTFEILVVIYNKIYITTKTNSCYNNQHSWAYIVWHSTPLPFINLILLTVDQGKQQLDSRCFIPCMLSCMGFYATYFLI